MRFSTGRSGAERVKGALIAVALTSMLCVSASGTISASWRQTGSIQRVYSPASGEEYAYAPSAVVDSGHTYYYTCHNASPGVIRDHVYFSQVDVAGAPPQQDFAVIQPGNSGDWDSMHVCDPTTIAAIVHYGGKTYRYVMFFLGSAQDNTGNQIGMAIANDLSGPWIKYPKPIVVTPFDLGMWGVGQPSATTINPDTGEMLLFYTAGGTNTTAWRRYLNLGDLDNPVIDPAVRVTNNGITGFDGSPDVLHNFDIAYDPPRGRFYAVREMAPYPTEPPTYISSDIEIISIDSASIWNGDGTWKSEARISPAVTGFPRNHNPGIVRNIYGMLPTANELAVVLSKSSTGSFPDSLWSYDIWQLNGILL